MQRKTPWLVALAFSAMSAFAFADDEACSNPSDKSAADSAVTNPADSASAYDRLANQLAQAQEDWMWVAVAPSFNDMDKDSNGVIDSKEAAQVGLDMSMADTNRDGVVTLNEYQALINPSGQSPDSGEATGSDQT